MIRWELGFSPVMGCFVLMACKTDPNNSNRRLYVSSYLPEEWNNYLQRIVAEVQSELDAPKTPMISFTFPKECANVQ